MRKIELEKKEEAGNQSDCYSKKSTPNTGVPEWYEIVADFIHSIKNSDGVIDDKK